MTPATVWIDLFNPTKDEDLLVEQALWISVPTREEMSEIEASSRLYQEGGAHYMTADRPASAGQCRTSRRSRTPVTFILAGNRLITVRYAEPRAFPIFLEPRAEEGCRLHDAASPCMVGLLEAIIDREADRVERIQGEVDKLSQTIFGTQGRRAHALAALRRQYPHDRARGRADLADRASACSRSTAC